MSTLASRKSVRRPPAVSWSRFAASFVLVGLLAGGGVARGAGLESEIDTIDGAADDLALKATMLQSDATPGSYIGADEAVVRFQDDLFLHLIGDHAPAAEGFFALVTTGALADMGMHRDAEWYLAESLSGLGNLQTAASRFQIIVEDPSHPFREDAVRRLLELYAEMGEDEKFTKLYNAEIVPGKVKTTGQITYSLARSFYKRGDRGSAKQYFLQVPADNPWYGRSRYFLGTIDVVDGNLDSARTYFAEVKDLSVVTNEDRQVHDLALLGLGRIAYHLRDFDAAFAAYSAISGDSAFQDDRLYELVWTSIRRSEWHDALNNVDIFLLAYPEHEKAAQLRLLQGHLNFQEHNWNDALVSYEQVIQDYTSIHDRFDQLSRTGAEADEQIARFLVATNPDLPPYAVALMRSDRDLGRALDLFGELEAQRAEIEASEQLISELQAFLVGSGAASSYERLLADAYVYRLRTVQHRLSLLDVEERWLAGLSDATVAGRLSALSPRRAALEERWRVADGQIVIAVSHLDAYNRELAEHRTDIDNARLTARTNDQRIAELEVEVSAAVGADRDQKLAEIERLRTESRDADAVAADANARISGMTAPDIAREVPVAEIDAIGTEIAALAAEYASARPQKTGQPVADRADAAHRSLGDSFVKLGSVAQSIESGSTGELGAVRQKFDDEVRAVAQERADYLASSVAARDVSTDLTRQGFGRLEDFFADSILKADMGIVDVYWAQKLDIDEQLLAVREEKDRTVAELERRFSLIREKMGEGP